MSPDSPTGGPLPPGHENLVEQLREAREKKHLAAAYQVQAEREAATKAHLTDDELPLQITVLARDPGAKVHPPYHTNEQPAQSATRHMVSSPRLCVARSLAPWRRMSPRSPRRLSRRCW